MDLWSPILYDYRCPLIKVGVNLSNMIYYVIELMGCWPVSRVSIDYLLAFATTLVGQDRPTSLYSRAWGPEGPLRFEWTKHLHANLHGMRWIMFASWRSQHFWIFLNPQFIMTYRVEGPTWMIWQWKPSCICLHITYKSMWPHTTLNFWALTFDSSWPLSSLHMFNI